MQDTFPITRPEALEQGLMYYDKLVPCKHGHKSPRFTKTWDCVECERIRCAKYRYNNREQINRRSRASRGWIRFPHQPLRKRNAC